MTAGKLDIVVEQGATFNRTLTWKDEAGTPFNLTGYTARMHMREHLASGTPFLTLTTENGGIVITPALGKLELIASVTATESIIAASGVYDLEVVSSSGVVTRLLQGNLRIERNVSR
jgi:hypothetical protein